MGPRSPQPQARPQPERKSFTPLVDCTVRVSPTLARLVRKCAETESGGASPRDALLIAAGMRPGETEELQARNTSLSADLAQEQGIAAQLRSSIEAARSEAAKRAGECKQLRRELQSLDDTSRENARIARERISALDSANARLEESLKHSLSLAGMDEQAARALAAFKSHLDSGGDAKTAALVAGGYDPAHLAAALEKHDRKETRAFDAAMERRTWRSRVALRLLGVGPRKS